ncbi:MAG: hypothetical protein ACRYFS_03615 [Janthinobacterium lividum]
MRHLFVGLVVCVALTGCSHPAPFLYSSPPSIAGTWEGKTWNTAVPSVIAPVSSVFRGDGTATTIVEGIPFQVSYSMDNAVLKETVPASSQQEQPETTDFSIVFQDPNHIVLTDSSTPGQSIVRDLHRTPTPPPAGTP